MDLWISEESRNIYQRTNTTFRSAECTQLMIFPTFQKSLRHSAQNLNLTLD